MDLNVSPSFSSKRLKETKDGEGQSQSPSFSTGSRLNRVVYKQLKKTDKDKPLENAEMFQDLHQVDEIQRHRRKFRRSGSSLSKISRYGSGASAIKDSTDLSTSGRKSKESRLRKKLVKTLKQTEDLVADEDQLKQTEEPEQFAAPRIPLPDQLPLSTDSSEEETSSCSATSRRARLRYKNVSPSFDPTQSDSVPNRSASTDLLLPSASGLRRRDCSNSSPSVLCPLIHQDPPLDVSRPDTNPLLYRRRRRVSFSMIQESTDHLYGSGSADHIAKMSSEQLSGRISPPRAPLSVSLVESGAEEITETNKGTSRQPETESVGSDSSTNSEEGGSSLYSSFRPFETGNFVRRAYFSQLPTSPFYPLDFSPHGFSMRSGGKSPPAGTSSAETMNQERFRSLTEEPEAGAEPTLPILRTLRPPIQPALSLPPNVSSPTVTSASTADTSSPNLDFSLSHQDESHSQYVGPFSQSVASYIPAFVPQSENVSTERHPEPFDLLELLGLKYSRQDTAGNQDEIMESVGHVSDSVPKRSASTDLLLPSASGLRRRDRSNSSPSVLCPLIHQDPPLDVSRPDANPVLYRRTQSCCSGMIEANYEEIYECEFDRDFESSSSFIKWHVDEISDCRSFAEINSSRSSSDIEEIKPAAEQTDGTEPQIRSENFKPAETLTAVLYEQLQNLELSQRTKSSSCLSQSCPSLSQDPPLDVSILPRAASLPSMKLQSSFEEFTPGFCGDADDETYRFQCSGPGLYQCRVSGLVFAMKGGGDVFYRVVPWNRTLLSPHGKKPAGPLFDISCLQQSVAQLHLPHCEVRSTGPCHFLSVAHVHDGGVEIMRPERITETHIIISISGFSAFGNVKDENSPADPVRALVLLFYRPAADPESEHEINVLMLPKNVVLNNVLRFRRKLDNKEIFLERPPDCKLQPNQVYSLSVSPGGDSVLVQPKEAEFDAESYENYLSKFCVSFEKMMKYRLSLKDSSSCSVWERRVCLSAAGVRRSCGPTRQNLSPKEQLMEIRINFKDGVSGPVLQSLMDNLLQENVINDSEMEEVAAERTRGEKARLLVDTVRRKGDDASSKMIHFLCELDQHFSEYLELM